MADSSEPLVNDLDLGIYYENTNSGNTTDVSMYIRGASISVWGDLRRFNNGGAQIIADFGSEVAVNAVNGYSVGTKFGRNSDVDTTSTPEDLWEGGGAYSGFNATVNENIQVFSSDANDVGTLVSSGTATGGDRTTLIDSGADFVSDGVAVGDILVNDTKFAHGIVTAVATTQLTLFTMDDGSVIPTFNSNSDTYRVVNAGDTGASLIRLEQLLNANYEQQISKYVILNGVSAVTLTGDYMRCSRAKVIGAGSSGSNEGNITIRQATTTANIFASVQPTGQTRVGCYTVPKGKLFLLKRIRVALTRANGSAGSATVSLNIRPKGEAWRGVRVFELQTGAPTEFEQIGGDVFKGGTDIKFTIESVSDNNSIFDGAFEYFLINDPYLD